MIVVSFSNLKKPRCSLYMYVVGVASQWNIDCTECLYAVWSSILFLGSSDLHWISEDLGDLRVASSLVGLAYCCTLYSYSVGNGVLEQNRMKYTWLNAVNGLACHTYPK